MHTCGRRLSESLYDDEKDDDPDYQVATEVCRACQALDRRLAQEADGDKALIEAGRTPSRWRRHTVYRFDELPPEVQQQIERQRAASGRRPHTGRHRSTD